MGGEIDRGIVTVGVVAHTGIAPYGALRTGAIAVLGLTPTGYTMSPLAGLCGLARIVVLGLTPPGYAMSPLCGWVRVPPSDRSVPLAFASAWAADGRFIVVLNERRSASWGGISCML
jgi:hypothetical protein